ncbi:tail fiber domain-containing protein [Sphingomonas paucimobilis]|uniref:tail fiber domain-containing protein n=1 Tax=Sphingomonas paucimobilis TaxID=13689 RepID=UPI00069F0CD9|nr:tail fiber domain-containing protein [Sphingomonas paucimobilis]
MSWYSAGSVTVANGSNVVTGAGTDFVANASIGEAFIGPDGRSYEIAQIVSATDLRLGKAYQAATGGGQAYSIQPTQSLARDLALGVAELIGGFAAVRDGVGQGNFSDGSVNTPALRFAADRDTGWYREGDNRLGIAAGGLRCVAFQQNQVTFNSTVGGRNQTGADIVYFSQTFTSDGGVPVSAVRAIQQNGDYPDAGGLGLFTAYGSLAERLRLESLGTVRPGSDNQQQFGTAAYRWSVVFAGTGTINTSDARAKNDISAIPDEWLDAWAAVRWQRYKFTDAVQMKGDDARWHIGLIAQEVRDAFVTRGIDALAIGLLCHDEWAAIPEKAEVRDEEGNITEAAQPARPSGDRWGLRYDECAAMEAAYQRRRIAQLEAQIAALSAQHG